MDMRDSTYVRLGNYAIDFWTELANEDGTINSIYNSGDGIHLNEAGHRILFERVVEAKIYEQIILPTSVDYLTTQIPSGFSLEQNYPNPFNPTTNIQFNLPHQALVTMRIYNILGQEISTLINKEMESGIHKITWDATNLAAGPYFYVIHADNFFETKKMLFIK
jgi:hypothetical protein